MRVLYCGTPTTSVTCMLLSDTNTQRNVCLCSRKNTRLFFPLPPNLWSRKWELLFQASGIIKKEDSGSKGRRALSLEGFVSKLIEVAKANANTHETLYFLHG